jgi:hypothetical protein
MRTKDKAIALALALCAIVAMATALAAPAGAETYGNGFQLSKFKLEIKGVQTMVQQHTHAAENECDISDSSSGSEKVTFRTTKPIYVTASHMKGETNPEFFSTRQLAIPTKAVVKRSYTSRISQPAIPCEDNGGGVETQFQPDCGTKVVQPFKVQLQYSERKKNGLLLTSYDEEDPFERCSGGGSYMTFPNLLVERTGSGKFIYAEVSQDELFDPKFQKWISIADGTRKEQDADSWVKTHIHWEVSFTRLKTKVPGA